MEQSMTDVSVLHLFLLGAFRIERGAQTIHLPRAKSNLSSLILRLIPKHILAKNSPHFSGATRPMLAHAHHCESR
jgi:hypothetical protein